METKPIISDFEEKYNTIAQILFQLADTTFMFGELGRGSGKSTEIIGNRLVRIAAGMPQSTVGIAADTYMSLWQNILPAILKYLNTYYKRGVHFEVGKVPPAHFKLPHTPIFDWKQTISTCWGTVFQLISADRTESALGKNFAHVIADEMLRVDGNKFQDRIIKTLRGDKEMHGRSHYFGGITGFSSTPQWEQDYDWFLDYEKLMNKELINEIMYVAWKVNEAQMILRKTTKQHIAIDATKFIAKWEGRLTELRRNQYFYLRASSLTNILVLGWNYIDNQFKTTTDKDVFKSSILAVRQKKVKNMFFVQFGKKNVFSDSYVYSKNNSGSFIIDTIEIDKPLQLSSIDLKYCNKDMPIIMGVDWGGFMSMVCAQRTKQNEFRVFKNFFVYETEQHAEIANNFNEFFKYHRRKKIIMHYDRAGNQRKYGRTNFDPNSAETDAKKLKIELEKLKWDVELRSIGQRVIYHWEHFRLNETLMKESDPKLPKIRICQNQCAELISSINNSPLKKTDGQIELDKTTERTLSYEEQIMFSPQIASSYMYMIFGEFNKHLDSTTKSTIFDYDTQIL